MTFIDAIPNQQTCALVGSKIEPDKDDSTLIGKAAPEAKVIMRQTIIQLNTIKM